MQRIVYLTAWAGIFLSAHVLFSQPGQKEGLLVGTVFAEDEDSGLAGAQVAVERTALTAVSDENGAFVLRLPSGIWRLRVSHIAYESVSKEIRILPQERHHLKIVLPGKNIFSEELVTGTVAPAGAASATLSVNVVSPPSSHPDDHLRWLLMRIALSPFL